MAGRETLNPGWRLIAGLYPFGTAAVAISLFLASLLLSWVGATVLELSQAVAGGLVLGVPATFAFARHVGRMMTEAERAR